MHVIRVFATVLLAATVGIGSVSAKTLRNAGIPAEIPPSSYQGKQYVDSKGCVYIRAGFSGNITWIPRVTRSRQVVCGQKPTFAKAPTPKPPAVATARPIPKPAPKPAPAAAPTPKPVPKPVASAPAAKPAPQRVVRTPVARPAPSAAPKPTRVSRPTAQAPVAAPAPKPRRVVRRAAPAPQPVAAPKPRRVVVTPAPTQRVVRRVVPSKPPAGYRAAWSDGRLNPNRAVGTANGQAQMELLWTNTVPRRLIDAGTGRKVTRQPTISSSTVAPAAGAYRYVQVGTFGNPQNARKTIARLQSMGLPVRVGKTRRNGKPLQIVMAGPFTRQSDLKSALSAARRAGYRDAILRK